MKYKPIYIEWLDSFGCTGKWEDIEDYKSQPLICKTIGFIVFEDNKVISIASNIAEETELTFNQANGIMSIPKVSIVKRKNVKM